MSAVVLVCMPFGPVFVPSIGLSLLKAGLTRRGVAARVRYFSIEFAERVGQAFYCGIASEGRPSILDLAGEWIFSRALFTATAQDDDAYVDEVLRHRSQSVSTVGSGASAALVQRILRARGKVDGFLELCLEELIRESPRLVGFTSAFQQHTASLALARRVKQALPETFIVFGGANCEGVMGAETVRQFPFVDAAVSGEADVVFPELVQRVLEARDVSGLPGVRTRDGVHAEFASGAFASAPMVRNLDELPYPDYADYFEQFGKSRYGREWQPSVFFETSRGCWWGEKMHCTFCGLNGQTMSYRSKSAERAVAELADLTKLHPDCAVQVTDNILDMKYFKDFLPQLTERRLGLELYYETKANLKKEQIRQLLAAGIVTLQPGIESLSDAVLKLMRKGVSGLQNIQLLKWCKELGVTPYWNLLWGFPGEPPEEYARMARLVPLLTHLEPPLDFGSIRLDRFSPNFFDSEKLGFAGVTPWASYRHVYRLPNQALANLAYYFDFRYQQPQDVASYVAPLARELKAWSRQSERSALFSADVNGRLLVWDLRPVSREPLTLLSGIDRILYQACDTASDSRQLAEAAQRALGQPIPPDEVARRLEPLSARGLLVKDGARYLALAVPLGHYTPGPPIAERFREVAGRLGRRVAGGVVVPANGERRPGWRVARSSRRTGKPRPRGARPHPSPWRFSFEETGELLIRFKPSEP